MKDAVQNFGVIRWRRAFPCYHLCICFVDAARDGFLLKKNCCDLLISSNLTSPKEFTLEADGWFFDAPIDVTFVMQTLLSGFLRKTHFFCVKKAGAELQFQHINEKIIPTLVLFLDICLWPVWLASPWSPDKTGSAWVVKQARHGSCDDGFHAPGYTKVAGLELLCGFWSTWSNDDSVVPVGCCSFRFGASHVWWLVWRLCRVLSTVLRVGGSLEKTLPSLFFFFGGK